MGLYIYNYASYFHLWPWTPTGFVSVIVTRRDNPVHAMYIMTVATILGILVPFTFTALTKYLVDYLVLKADESTQRQTYTLLSQEESAFFAIDLQPTTTTISSTSTVSIRRLLIFDHIITGIHTQEFQTTTTPVLMLLLVGQAALMCGIMSCTWQSEARTHRHRHTRRYTHKRIHKYMHTNTHTHTSIYVLVYI